LQNFGLDTYCFAKKQNLKIKNKKNHMLAACLKKPGPSYELGPKERTPQARNWMQDANKA